MGDFRIVIEAAGGHGCQREFGNGELVYGCGRIDCPDCQVREFVRHLQAKGCSVSKADLIHWPADMEGRSYTADREVRDNLLSRIRSGSFALVLLCLAALLPAAAQAQGPATAALGLPWWWVVALALLATAAIIPLLTSTSWPWPWGVAMGMGAWWAGGHYPRATGIILPVMTVAVAVWGYRRRAWEEAPRRWWTAVAGALLLSALAPITAYAQADAPPPAGLPWWVYVICSAGVAGALLGGVAWAIRAGITRGVQAAKDTDFVRSHPALDRAIDLASGLALTVVSGLEATLRPRIAAHGIPLDAAGRIQMRDEALAQLRQVLRESGVPAVRELLGMGEAYLVGLLEQAVLTMNDRRTEPVRPLPLTDPAAIDAFHDLPSAKQVALIRGYVAATDQPGYLQRLVEMLSARAVPAAA